MSIEWVSNPDFIADVYDYVKNCARILPNSLKNISGSNLCALDISKSDVPSRYVDCQPSPANLKLSYHEEDITIYGGAALQLYDYRFALLKPIGFGTAKNAIGKATTDIDMVWWPRSSMDTRVATARSSGIKTMCEEFKTMLYIRSTYLKRVIQPKLGFSPDITIGMFDSLAYGAYTITITFAWGKNTHRVCEISIHDSASSQLSPTLQYMTHDVVHMSNSDTYPDHKVDTLVYGPQQRHISVPNYSQFIQQQFFALNRILFDPSGALVANLDRRTKGIIIWRRMQYLKELLKATYYTLPFDAAPLILEIDYSTVGLIARTGDVLHTYCNELATQYPIEKNYAMATLCGAAAYHVFTKRSHTRDNKKGRKMHKARKSRKSRKV